MKKIMMYITTLALCFMVMGDLTFAAETEVPAMDERNAKTEEIITRAAPDVDEVVSRSTTISIAGLPTFTAICRFNIRYNSGTGYLYSVGVKDCTASMGNVFVRATIEDSKRISSTTMDVTVQLAVYTGGMIRGDKYVTFRI